MLLRTCIPSLLLLLSTAAYAAPGPDLSVTLATPRNAYAVPSVFPATVEVRNVGDAESTNVSVSGLVPASFTLHGINAPPSWICSRVAQYFICTTTSVAPASTSIVTLSLAAAGMDTFANITAVGTSTADADPSNDTGDSGVVFSTHGQTCGMDFGMNALAVQTAFHTGTPVTWVASPGADVLVSFRLCNTTTTEATGVQYSIDLPAEVSADLTDSSSGWTCSGTPTHCSIATNESALSDRYAPGNTARKELHLRVSAISPPDLWAGSWSPPQFNWSVTGSYGGAGGSPLHNSWGLLPASPYISDVTFGTPTFTDRAGAPVATWQPEGLALIPVTLTSTGNLAWDWLMHYVNAPAWVALDDQTSEWSCIPGGSTNHPGDTSSCRLVYTRQETPRGTPATKLIALRASSEAPSTGEATFQFCSGNQVLAGLLNFPWGPNINNSISGGCAEISLPFGQTTPVSLQSFSVD